MEIKDKITARKVAMQMATETMCAIISRRSETKGYDVNEHIELAKSLYSYIVGNANIPEVYNPNENTSKLIDMISKAQDNNRFNHDVVWFPIIIHNDKVNPIIIDAMRKSIPIYLRSRDEMINVVGSVKEFDKIVESGGILNYKDYAFVFSPDSNNPFERDKVMGLEPQF